MELHCPITDADLHRLQAFLQNCRKTFKCLSISGKNFYAYMLSYFQLENSIDYTEKARAKLKTQKDGDYDMCSFSNYK